MRWDIKFSLCSRLSTSGQCSPSLCEWHRAFNYQLLSDIFRAIPETKGRSLEEMDIIFGTVSAEERNLKIRETEKGQNLDNLVIASSTF